MASTWATKSPDWGPTVDCYKDLRCAAVPIIGKPAPGSANLNQWTMRLQPWVFSAAPNVERVLLHKQVYLTLGRREDYRRKEHTLPKTFVVDFMSHCLGLWEEKVRKKYGKCLSDKRSPGWRISWSFFLSSRASRYMVFISGNCIICVTLRT